jgi:hypothetical protein
MHLNTIIVGEFNTLLSPIDSHWDKKLNKETSQLIDTIAQMDLIDT